MTVSWKVEFYRDRSGREPAREFFDGLLIGTRARVLRLIDLLSESGVLLKEPYTRHIKGKLRELRLKDSLAILGSSISPSLAGAFFWYMVS